MDSKQLQIILEKHKCWLVDNTTGERANLSWANLSGANLSWANLSRANLSRADLSRADLISFHFVLWNGYAQAERLIIGCHDHNWEDWKKHGKGYAKANNCLDEFKEFWSALEVMRKILVKRAKKRGSK